MDEGTCPICGAKLEPVIISWDNNRMAGYYPCAGHQDFWAFFWVRRGIEPLCGWRWIGKHLHDLDNWTPTIEYSGPGHRFKVAIKDNKQLNTVSKMIRGK